jgi:two-component system, chemotaxis family, chemotaxis protein CheY
MQLLDEYKVVFIAIITCVTIGAMGFIVKPFEPDGMLDVIRKIAEPS